MSNDLISRKALLKEFDRVCVDGVMAHGANVNLEIEFVRAVQKAPSVDPHKHGRWREVGITMEYHHYTCSACKHNVKSPGRFCPNCGAMMDGGEKQ